MKRELSESDWDGGISEAFVSADEGRAAEPSDQHVKELHQALMQRTVVAPVREADGGSVSVSRPLGASPSDETRPHRPARWWVSVASVAALALLMFAATRMVGGTANASLDSALTSSRDSRWIHGRTVVSHQAETFESQSWCSHSLRLAAFQSSGFQCFVDYRRGIQTLFDARSGSLIRSRADQSYEGFGRSFVSVLLSQGDLATAYPGHHVSRVEKTRLKVRGATFERLSFQVDSATKEGISWSTEVDVEPTSGRIALWRDQFSNGVTVTTEFDYPAAGPSDIYDLGVSRKLTEVDMIPPDDIRRLTEK